jgi:hypothetical protein
MIGLILSSPAFAPPCQLRQRSSKDKSECHASKDGPNGSMTNGAMDLLPLSVDRMSSSITARNPGIR